MAYISKKKINGRYYLYLQSSYRVGKRIYTTSQYLCPAGGDASQALTDGKAGEALIQEILNETRGKLTPKQKKEENVKSSLRSNILERHLTLQKKIKASVKEKKAQLQPTLDKQFKVTAKLEKCQPKVSALAMSRELQNSFVYMRKAGIDPEKTPTIEIKKGSTVALKRRRKDGSYVVTVPRKAKNLNKRVRGEFSKAVARTMLSGLALQQPAKYAGLMATWDESFKQSQKFLCAYVRTASPSGWVKALALHFWGTMSTITQKHLPEPHRMGLIDFSQRKTPEDELVTMLAHVQKHGMTDLKKSLTRDMKYAEKQLFIFRAQLERSCFPYSQKFKKEWKKWELRRRSLEEMKYKMKMVTEVFGVR